MPKSRQGVDSIVNRNPSLDTKNAFRSLVENVILKTRSNHMLMCMMKEPWMIKSMKSTSLVNKVTRMMKAFLNISVNDYGYKFEN